MSDEPKTTEANDAQPPQDAPATADKQHVVDPAGGFAVVGEPSEGAQPVKVKPKRNMVRFPEVEL